MGGDDLGGSDDELLLWNQTVVAGDRSSSDEEGDDDNDLATNNDDEAAAAVVAVSTTKKKRNIAESNTISSPNKKKKLSPAQLLLQAGRHIENQDVTEQAAFLTTAIKHYCLLQQQQQNNNDDNDDDLEILPRYLVTKDKNSNRLVDCLRDCTSAKKLKQWKTKQSPCVLIVCISARRAVTVLKELQMFKVRCAKFFPKNGSVEQQRQQLSETPFALAVGTPHRLQQLASKSNSSSDAVLSLEQTQLVVFDCDLSNKQYNVCTLPDTAPHCMAFTREAILPQLRKRKDCKIAFF